MPFKAQCILQLHSSKAKPESCNAANSCAKDDLRSVQAIVCGIATSKSASLLVTRASLLVTRVFFHVFMSNYPHLVVCFRQVDLGRTIEPSGISKGTVCPFVSSSFLFLVVRPGAPSSVLAPSSDALCS